VETSNTISADECSFSIRIDAFHDGELSATEQSAVRQHLNTCPACAAQLSQLQQMSRFFGENSDIRLSQIAMARLNNRLKSETSRGVIRLAWAMNAIAAAILVAGTVWLQHLQAEDSARTTSVAVASVTAPPWTGIAAANPDLPGKDAATPAAEFYLADATQKSADLP